MNLTIRAVCVIRGQEIRRTCVAGVVVALWACGLSTGTALAVEPGPAPRLVCEEPAWRFGCVTNVTKLSHAFTLKNEGTAPLTILRVRACCGASYALSRTELPPGSNAVLRIDLSLASRTGRIMKSVYVQSNDPAQRIMALLLAGERVTDPHATVAGPKQRSSAGAADKP